MKLILLLGLACLPLAAQTPDPARDLISSAYEAIENGDPARAIALFEQARASAPAETRIDKQLGYLYRSQGDYERSLEAFLRALERSAEDPALLKDLGYLYLKMGETDPARKEFERAAAIDPLDQATQLELAFLEHESGLEAAALRRFRGLAESVDEKVRETARTALAGIEAELDAAIGRWENEVRRAPRDRSALLELAKLFERADEPAKAAQRYLEAWRASSSENSDEVLPRLARARQGAGDVIGARGAWLLASRSEETRIAETSRERLPDRFPWASEFRAALAIDEQNTALRRELAYLLLEVGMREEAQQEFETLTRFDPDDLQAAAQLAFLYLEQKRPAEAARLLDRAREGLAPDAFEDAQAALSRLRRESARPHRELAEKSLKASYLEDAKREFFRAYRLNPADDAAAYKLGVVHNLLKQDREALRWFEIASRSPDPGIAEPAGVSYRNLEPQFRRFSTTLWLYPFFSSRYDTVFGYAQVKGEFRFDRIPVRPYVSLRFAGDVRQRTGGAAPQYLSEGSLIPAVGLRAPLGRGVTLWGEAGASIAYTPDTAPGVPRAGGDFRGGLNLFRGGGSTLGGNEAGRFWETNLDAVYLSRFDDDVIGYWQLRPGYRPPNWKWLKSQLYLNFNLTLDAKRRYWANYAEIGPGFRFRAPGVKPAMNIFVDFVRGVHLTNRDNPRSPNYFDFRAGVWYSFTM